MWMALAISGTINEFGSHLRNSQEKKITWIQFFLLIKIKDYVKKFIIIYVSCFNQLNLILG